MTRIEQHNIDVYAGVSGDHNPLHVDPDFATSTRFGSTIVHGHLLLGLIGARLEERHGRRWASSGVLEVKFVAPVYAGDEVEVDLVDDGAVTLSVGERVCVVGTARVADDEAS